MYSLQIQRVKEQKSFWRKYYNSFSHTHNFNEIMCMGFFIHIVLLYSFTLLLRSLIGTGLYHTKFNYKLNDTATLVDYNIHNKHRREIYK